MFEESSISNTVDITKSKIYRSIPITIKQKVDEHFKIPLLPFYWRLNSLNHVINIDNTQIHFEKTKSFIQEQNILFKFNNNCFNCSIYDNEIKENIKFDLYFWNKKDLNENEFIFEFQCINIYNFNNIFRIYDIYNSFCVLFGGNNIKYNLIDYNVNNLTNIKKKYNKNNNHLVSNNDVSIQLPIIKC